MDLHFDGYLLFLDRVFHVVDYKLTTEFELLLLKGHIAETV